LNSLELTVTSIAGTTHSIEASTDLQNWSPIMVFVAAASMTNITVPAPAESAYQFYRVLKCPSMNLFADEAAPRLAVTRYLGEGWLESRLSGIVGRSYRIEASSDLRDWTSVLTNTLTSAQIRLVIPGTSSAYKQFYRAVTLP
jgi:hypothetical protein